MLQLVDEMNKQETVKALLEEVPFSLRHLIILVNQAAVAFNTPSPTPDQVLEYIHSIPHLSCWVKLQKRA